MYCHLISVASRRMSSQIRSARAVRLSVRHLLLAGVTWAAVSLLGDATFAQRILLFEDFESSIPDVPANEGVASLDTFNRSEVLENDPGTITVTGGQFPDPFPSSGGGFDADFDNDGDVDGDDLHGQPLGWASRYGTDLDGGDFLRWQCELGGVSCGGGGGNQSLLFYNPNSAVQQAANWFTIFPEDPNDPNFYLKNGVIEFDAYLEQVPSDGFWTYFGIRLGFEFNAEDRNQVTTEGDQNIWNSFRMQDGGLASANGNFLFDQVNPGQFFDETVIVTDMALHVRYEIDGVNGVYSVFIDNLTDEDPEVEVIDDQPWTMVFDFSTFMLVPAPGINEVTFITDASSRSAGSLSAGNVYLDNLLIIDNDQAPDGAAVTSLAAPEPASACLLLLAASLAATARRTRQLLPLA